MGAAEGSHDRLDVIHDANMLLSAWNCVKDASCCCSPSATAAANIKAKPMRRIEMYMRIAGLGLDRPLHCLNNNACMPAHACIDTSNTSQAVRVGVYGHAASFDAMA